MFTEKQNNNKVNARVWNNFYTVQGDNPLNGLVHE